MPDPLTLPKKEWSGEESGGLQKWPPVYYHDISDYLEGINTPADFLHRLNCDYKEGKSYRYFACDFVKEIYYHPVSTESKICFLKCLVTPSQRTSSKPYTVWASIEKFNPGGKITSAYCTCTAGLLGSCNHVTAMLFRVEAAFSSGITKPTCTSKLSTWNVPAPTKTILSLKPICEYTVSKSNYKNGRDKSENDKNRLTYKSYSPYEEKPMESPEMMRQKILGLVKDSVPESRFVEVMERKKKRKITETKIPCESTYLSSNVIKQAERYVYNESTNIENNVNKFTKTLLITKEQINNIYENTKEQSNTQLWHNLRKGRITASKFHNVYTKVNTVIKNSETPTDLLVNDLIERRMFETVATKHGISMETHAKEKFKKNIAKTHVQYKFQESGMVISDKLPFLSASPDLEGSCECCGDFVVEIKCPYSICETVPTAENLNYLREVKTEDTTMLKLKTTHTYYTQIQGQLALTKKRLHGFSCTAIMGIIWNVSSLT